MIRLLLLTSAVSIVLGAPNARAAADESLKVTVSLYHQYGYGKTPDGKFIERSDREKIGSLRGVLIRNNDAKGNANARTSTGVLQLASVGLLLPLSQVESTEYTQRCGFFGCNSVPSVGFALKGRQVSQLVHAILEKRKNDISAHRYNDASWIVAGCIDDRLRNSGRYDYCSAETLWAGLSSLSLTTDSSEGVYLSFMSHGGSAAGFSFDLSDKIEISNFSRKNLAPPGNQISFSSLMLWIEVSRDRFAPGRTGN